MNIKSIVLFVSGLFVGGAAGVLGTRKYFQDKYQKRYEEDHDALEEYYKRTDEYQMRDRTKGEKSEEQDENAVNPIEEDSNPGGRMSSAERDEIKKKLNQNWAGTTNYAAMYRNVECFDGETHQAEEEYPKDDVPEICKYCAHNASDSVGYCDLIEEPVNFEDTCSDFKYRDDHEISPEEEAFDEHQKNKDRPPRIISAEAYSNLPQSIDQGVLYFYAYDEMLCDENEEPVEEPERLVGDALTKYGFVDNDERILFVMNYALDTCYEIQKLDMSWTDLH